MDLTELARQLADLPPEEREKLEGEAMKATAHMRWVPNPGPQAEAYFCEADELLYGGVAGPGKALALDTPIPTAAGWSTMGELAIGDEVFAGDGARCRVTFATDVMLRRPCFRVEFSDGASVVADAEHRWVTSTALERGRVRRATPASRARRRLARPARGTGKRPDLAKRNTFQAEPQPLPLCAVRTTAQIAASLKIGKRLNHAVAVAGALQAAQADVLIEPYVLGAWLGDGSSRAGSITGIDQEIFQQVANSGYVVSRRKDPITPGILGLQKQLRLMGLLGNKHIPPAYFRGSAEQRLALLQGLMDTDGSCDKDGCCSFTSTRKQLADDFLALLMTLGVKARIGEGKAKLNGRIIGPKYTVNFIAALPVFRLPRKLLRQKRSGFRGTHALRYITAVVPVESVPVRCIQVDSPSRTYLCGRAMIPTHNTDLGIGLSLTAHKRSLVLRRTNAEAVKLFDRYEEIIGHQEGKNEQKGWRIDGRIIDIGGCQLEGDKQKRKGIPHDLKFFDELVDFTESQYTFIITWNRSTDPTQRCRVVASTNPPVTPEGMWVVRRWAPWLDPSHPRPAKSGEIRWFTTIGDKDTEVRAIAPGDDHPSGAFFVLGHDGTRGAVVVDGKVLKTHDGKEIRPKSRCFIRGYLKDNPDLTQTEDYQNTLNALPAELRAAFAEGRFEAGLKDQPLQIIPTAWIRAAQERWTPKPPHGIPMCGMGVDCSGGGPDPMAIAPRYDGYYPHLIMVPGKDIPAHMPGKYAAGVVVMYRRGRAIVVVDMGGGYGGPLYEQLRENEIECVGYKGAASSVQRTAEGQLLFYNMRTQLLWRFREALDPMGHPGGSPITLPPDPELLADLVAPTFKLTRKDGQQCIQAEPKEEVMVRLGRSPNKGDAVIMAWSAGPTFLTDGRAWEQQMAESAPMRRTPQVIMGRHNAARRR